MNFANFTKLPEKFKLPAKRGFKLTEMRRANSFLPPQPTLSYILSKTSVVWNIPIDQFGWLAVLPPGSCTTCSLAEQKKLEKVLDFIVTTENISGISILLVLNPKHSSCWEEKELYPSQNQDGVENK